MDEQMIEAAARAIYLVNPQRDQETDGDGRACGPAFDVPWETIVECIPEVANLCREQARAAHGVMAGKVAEIADDLTDQRDEPIGAGPVVRLHYWRDKAITAAERLAALAPYPEHRSE